MTRWNSQLPYTRTAGGQMTVAYNRTYTLVVLVIQGGIHVILPRNYYS